MSAAPTPAPIMPSRRAVPRTTAASDAGSRPTSRRPALADGVSASMTRWNQPGPAATSTAGVASTIASLVREGPTGSGDRAWSLEVDDRPEIGRGSTTRSTSLPAPRRPPDQRSARRPCTACRDGPADGGDVAVVTGPISMTPAPCTGSARTASLRDGPAPPRRAGAPGPAGRADGRTPPRRPGAAGQRRQRREPAQRRPLRSGRRPARGPRRAKRVVGPVGHGAMITRGSRSPVPSTAASATRA